MPWKSSTWKWIIPATISLLAVIGVASYFSLANAGTEKLLAYRGKWIATERRFVERAGEYEIHDITLRDDRQTWVSFLLRQPVNTTRKFPAVVILGGVDIGKETLQYVGAPGEVIVVALGYPYDLSRVTGWWAGIREAGKMREAAFRTVAGALLVNDFLRQQENVDTNRVTLVGYSFGAPFVPAVMHLDPRYKVAAFLYGGGRINKLVGHNLDSGFRPFDRLLGEAVGLLLAPIEPHRHIKYISPRPLIMIQGKHDEFMPPSLAQELFARAGEPKELIWLETEHMMPWKKEVIDQVVMTLRQRLERNGYL
ncbi:alpha/beta hydrolase [candidate division KSB1 bacterium]|nr:alpha/beta hydrolase [candidate division KSB1 bacterium]